MDFPQFNVARTELKELRRGPMTQHFHVEVALIDRSQHQGVFPQVFQLKNDYQISTDQLDAMRRDFDNLQRDAFKLIGEALQVDPEKKLIVLTDDNLITYKYLIVVASPCHANEFNAFLPTLKDVLLLEAMNAKAKISDTSKGRSSSPYFSKQTPDFTASGDSKEKSLSPLVKDRISSEPQPSNSNVSAKRLCQVKT